MWNFCKESGFFDVCGSLNSIYWAWCSGGGWVWFFWGAVSCWNLVVLCLASIYLGGFEAPG